MNTVKSSIEASNTNIVGQAQPDDMKATYSANMLEAMTVLSGTFQTAISTPKLQGKLVMLMGKLMMNKKKDKMSMMKAKIAQKYFIISLY